MKKKLFRLGLILCLILSLTLAVAAEETEIPTGGQCGEDVFWSYDAETLTLTLTGTGATFNYDLHFDVEQSPLTVLSKNVQIRSIVVESGITGLGNYALAGIEYVESVSLPDGLETIGWGALAYCHALKEISLPDSVTAIGSYAFSSCTDLKQIVIPSGVTEIPESTFSDCSALISVTVPEGVEIIGYGAFSNCRALTEVHLPDSLIELHSAFENCPNLVSINVPPNLKVLNLAGLPITECDIPEGVTELAGTFHNCTKLERVTIPEGVTTIGAYTFARCTSLKEIQLPSTLKVIGESAFNECGIEALVLPEGVTTIGYHAFGSCYNLKNLTIPASVKDISTFHEWSDQLVIHCWANTHAQRYVFEQNLTYTLMPEPEDLTTYTVTGTYNGLGHVAMAGYEIPAGRIGILEAIPYSGCFLESITLYDASGNLLNHQIQSGQGYLWWFEMPEQDVSVEILFNIEYMPFQDVPWDAYYLAPVFWANTYGITTGTSATTFSPDDPCTRGQVVTFLWRAAGSPQQETTKNRFTDVKEGDYYYDAVQWAVEYGITNGTSETTFSPDTPCTRAQVATFLWRTAGQPETESSKHSFTDIKKDYYYDAVLWAVEFGITNGTSETTFSPANTCTRAQIVTFLHRFLG